ncbi:unnamed protein product [Cunninghamella blakesleeana]
MNIKTNGYTILQQYRYFILQSQKRQQQFIIKRNNSQYASLTSGPDIVQRYLRPSIKLKENKDMFNNVIKDFIIIPDFITEEEHDKIVKNCESKLKRSLGRNAIYEQGHFDGVITKYKECSASHWVPLHSEKAKWMDQFIQQRIYLNYFPPSFEWLDPHILDLAKEGEIRGHVDNKEASGSVVAGLCLKSPCKMILQHEDDDQYQLDILLKPRTFYIQRDFVRYQFKHAIASDKESIWDNEPFNKTDRISLLFRNKKGY